MRTLPTGRRLAVCGLAALAGLLLAAAVRPAAAEEGVARASDGKAAIVGVSHSDPCVMEPAPHRNYAPRGTCSKGCGPACQCGAACQCSGCGQNGACGSNGSCSNCKSSNCKSCKGGLCGKSGSSCLCGKGSNCKNGSCCRCGSGCECAKCGSGLGKLFGKDSKNCRCGSGCQCGKGGLGLCGGGRCKACCDLNGDGYADPIGNGVCKGCGAHGSLFGHGYCGQCCGGAGCLGIPCLGVPCLGLPCLGGGGCLGCLAGLGTRPGGAIGGRYSRVYAVNPYYHDFRDGAVYAAQGYNAPIAVPLAPNVDYQYNYGWGIPSSRLTPVSRVVPSPYGPQPQYAVPPGYVPAGYPGYPGGVAAGVTAEASTDTKTDTKP